MSIGTPSRDCGNCASGRERRLRRHRTLRPETSRGLSQRFPIPIAILARLAVDAGEQGHGIGAGLLDDALARVVRASEEIAVRAVVVHAIDDGAASFYARYDFRALTVAPRTLMVTIAALREAGYLGCP